MWTEMVASLRELCDYAAPKGVEIAIQNHNSSSFCMYAWQILRMIKDVDRGNFSHIMDTGQWKGAIGSAPRGNPSPKVDLYADYLEKVAQHATGVRAKIYQIDSGVEVWIDYPRVMEILSRAGFDGIISLVFELETVFEQKEAAGVAHKSPEECARLAVSYLRKCIAGTAKSPPPLPVYPEPIEWAQPVTEEMVQNGFSRL